MNARLIILLVFLMLISACQDLDTWKDVPENTYSDFVFPTEGVLSLKVSTASEVTAALYFWTPLEGDLESAELRFIFEGMSCKANKKHVTLSADNLSGTVTCFRQYRGKDKVGSESLSGKFIFNANLGRTMYQFGDVSHLGKGDKLNGNWTVRFEADNGTRLLFKASSVDVVTSIPF